MRKTKITLATATILQLEAGEQEAVRDGGNLYVLLQSEEGFTEEKDDTSPEPEKAPTKVAVKKTVTETVVDTAEEQEQEQEEAEDSSESWTDAEMLAMPTKKLSAELERLGIDPNETDGKNTNKKLRELILDYWSADVVDDAKAEKEDAPEEKSEIGEIEIPRDDWKSLKEGNMVMAKLDMDGEDGDKLWEAEVVGWKKPKGSREEQ